MWGIFKLKIARNRKASFNRCKWRTVAMGDYHPIASSIVACSEQKQPVEICIYKDGRNEARMVIFKSAVGWREAFKTQWGIKHCWRNSIDVFDSGIWARIDQLLIAAPFPQFFKGLIIIAHTEKNRAQWQAKLMCSPQIHHPPPHRKYRHWLWSSNRYAVLFTSTYGQENKRRAQFLGQWRQLQWRR